MANPKTQAPKESKPVGEIPLTPLDNSVKQPIRGNELLRAPQGALTTAVSTAWATSGGAATHLDASNTTRLDNMYARINQLETALKNLGLIK